METEIQEDKRALGRGQLERKRNRGEKRNLLPQKPQRVERICEPKGQKEGAQPDRGGMTPGGTVTVPPRPSPGWVGARGWGPAYFLVKEVKQEEKAAASLKDGAEQEAGRSCRRQKAPATSEQ